MIVRINLTYHKC